MEYPAVNHKGVRLENILKTSAYLQVSTQNVSYLIPVWFFLGTLDKAANTTSLTSKAIFVRCTDVNFDENEVECNLLLGFAGMPPGLFVHIYIYIYIERKFEHM